MKTKEEYRVYCAPNGNPIPKDSFYSFTTKEEAVSDMIWRRENIGRAGYYYELVKVTFEPINL